MSTRLKEMLKALARPFWRMTAPVRRPAARKFDDRVTRLVEEALRAHRPEMHVSVAPPDFTQIEAAVREMAESLRMARQVSEYHASEANLLMDSLVREITRQQMQIEDLAETIEAMSRDRRLTLMNPDERDAHLRAG